MIYPTAATWFTVTAQPARPTTSCLASTASAAAQHLRRVHVSRRGQIVVEDYAQAAKLDYTGAANSFSGFDRFGRVVDQVWSDYGSNPSVLDEYTYTYDRSGNRTAKTNVLDSALSETYEYDDLARLIAYSVSGTQQKTWSLDSLGNNLAAGTYTAANEETPTVGSSGYDLAGNMTTLQNGDTATYDAWDRLAKVLSNSTIVQKNEYDGTNRRIQIFSNYSGGTPGTTEDDYLSGQQVIETRENAAVKYQQIWSPRYIDAAILRDTYSSGSIVQAARVFYLSDANYNVTGLVKCVDNVWGVAERYTYTPYGVVTYRLGNWSTTGSSANSNTTLYTGRTLELLTAIYYYRGRYYDPLLERFITTDPMGVKAGMNFFRYADNDPADGLDPFGWKHFGEKWEVSDFFGGTTSAMDKACHSTGLACCSRGGRRSRDRVLNTQR